MSNIYCNQILLKFAYGLLYTVTIRTYPMQPHSNFQVDMRIVKYIIHFSPSPNKSTTVNVYAIPKIYFHQPNIKKLIFS